VIGGGELKIYPSKMEAIMKWPVPTNVYEIRFFIGETQHLRKFKPSFFSGNMTSPRHNNKWKEFLVGERSTEGSQGAKEEDQSSTNSGITRLAATL